MSRTRDQLQVFTTDAIWDDVWVSGTTSSLVPRTRPGLPICGWLASRSTLFRIRAATVQAVKRLDALAQCSKRSKSFLAAEAIAQYVEAEEWQLGEIRAGLAGLDEGRSVSHDKVSKWLKSWGEPSEGKAPR